MTNSATQPESGTTRADIVRRARDLAPALGDRAMESERLRRVPDETVREFADAGFYRIFQPSRFGGHELEYGTQVDMAIELARFCASSAWDASIIACHSWILGMFPAQAQDDVWGDDSQAVLATSFVPVGARVVRAGDGLRVSGRWKLTSGVDHCDWVMLTLGLEPDGGGEPDPLLVLVALRDCTIEDTWFATGLTATGSNDVVLDDCFVPAHRMMRMMELRGDPTPGGAVNAGYIYRLPMLASFTFNLVGVALGTARGAVESTLDGIRERTSVAEIRLAEQQSVQLRLAESRAEVDAAHALVSRNLDRLNLRGRNGEAPDIEERTLWRSDNAFAVMACVRAVDRIYPLVGGRGLAPENPINRAWRDIHAISHHLGVTWDVQGRLHTAVALGLPSPDPKI